MVLEPKIVTFIRCCSMKKETKDLEELLSEGININEFGPDGRTALMEACRFNKNPEIVDFLLKQGADVKSRTKTGETALLALGQSEASVEAVEEILHKLISHGADINECDFHGETILHIAARRLSRPELINVFIKNGANPHLGDKQGDTPAEFVMGTTKEPNCVKECLKTAPDIYALWGIFMSNKKMLSFSDGWNKESVEECIRLFLDKGVDINYQTEKGMTILMRLCLKNSEDFQPPISGFFLNKKIKQPNLSALAEIIKILIKNGADTGLQDCNSQTVFDMCNNKKELLEALSYKGK